MLHFRSNHGLLKKAHQVIGQHRQTHRGVSGLKLLRAKLSNAEIGVDFLDAVLALRTAPVVAPDLHIRQGQRGHLAP